MQEKTNSDFDKFFEKLTQEESSGMLFQEKIDLLSRVAIDNLRDWANGDNMLEKGAALLALVAVQDECCERLAIEFMDNYNLDLKSYGIQASTILKKESLNDKVEELLLDNSASIRIKALTA